MTNNKKILITRCGKSTFLNSKIVFLAILLHFWLLIFPMFCFRSCWKFYTTRSHRLVKKMVFSSYILNQSFVESWTKSSHGICIRILVWILWTGSVIWWSKCFWWLISWANGHLPKMIVPSSLVCNQVLFLPLASL